MPVFLLLLLDLARLVADPDCPIVLLVVVLSIPMVRRRLVLGVMIDLLLGSRLPKVMGEDHDHKDDDDLSVDASRMVRDGI